MRSYPDFLQIIERCAQLERAYTLLRPADAAKMLGVTPVTEIKANGAK